MTAPVTAAVVGGGTMGAGIAHVLLAAGGRVTVAEADADRADAAREGVARSLRKAQERGKLDEPAAALLARLSTVDALADLPPGADLVVEAVPEDLDLKRRVLGEVAGTCANAVLASNTSSLSITALAAGLPGERVVGMHFFNPVPVQQLVEIVTHEGLPASTLATVRGYGPRRSARP